MFPSNNHTKTYTGTEGTYFPSDFMDDLVQVCTVEEDSSDETDDELQKLQIDLNPKFLDNFFNDVEQVTQEGQLTFSEIF